MGRTGFVVAIACVVVSGCALYGADDRAATEQGQPTTARQAPPASSSSDTPPTGTPDSAPPQAPPVATLPFLVDMTFESGLTGPEGAEATKGTVLLDTKSPLYGVSALHVDGTNAGASRSFPAQKEIYISFLYRLDADPPSEPKMIVVDGSSYDIKLGISDQGLKVCHAEDHRVADHPIIPLTIGKTYRVGMHLATTGLVEAWVREGCGPFGAPFVSHTDPPMAPMTGITVGALDQQMSGTFDNVRVLASAMPPCEL